jgi:hypothetical protein
VGYRPQIPDFSVLCPQLNLLNPPPLRTKFLGTPLMRRITKCLLQNTGHIIRLDASEKDCTERDAEILPRCVVHNATLTYMRLLMAAQWCPSNALQTFFCNLFSQACYFVLFTSFLFAFIDSFISIYITNCYQHTKCYQQVLLLHFASFYSSIYSMSRLNFHYAVYSYSFIHEFDWPKFACSLIDDYRDFEETDCFHVESRFWQER